MININVPLSNLGDTIMSLPAVVYYINHINKNSKIYTNYNSFGLLRVIGLENNEIKCHITKNENIRIASWGNNTDKKENHYVENAFLCITNDLTKIDKIHFNYPKYIKKNKTYDFINKKHIIIASSYHDIRRKLSEISLNKIISYIKEKNFIPVFIGSKKYLLDHSINNSLYRIDYSLGLNLINKTGFEDLLNIFSNAKMLIAADGGIIHLAALTNIPIIGIYTIADPKRLLPIRNSILGFNCHPLSPDIGCLYCYTKTEKWINTCALNSNDPMCVRYMPTDKIIHVIDNIISD